MKKKILVILLVLIFLYCIGGVIYSIVIKQIDKKNEHVNIITINNYDYKLNADKETSLYKKEFNLLKNNLESDQINFKEYATSIAKLYIIDLYTLSTKANKYDITSNQYIWSTGRDNYTLKVSETLYKYIEDNTLGKRSQELPKVSEVIIKNIEESTYLIGSNEYPSYVITIEWLYEKDFGYDVNAVITLINDNDIISVVEENKMNDEQKNS